MLQSVAPKLGCTAETLRKWVRQAQRDAWHRPGLTTSERVVTTRRLGRRAHREGDVRGGARPRGMSVTRGCVLMGLPRSTFYDAPSVAVDDTEIVSRMQAICDEFETYGYRRVGATPVGGSVRRRVGGASAERVPLQQRPDEPQRQQPSDPERRDGEPPPQPGEPGQAGRPDRRRGRRARQREQRTRQGALQHAREYRTELRDAIVVAAHLIDDADPSRDEVRRKNEYFRGPSPVRAGRSLLPVLSALPTSNLSVHPRKHTVATIRPQVVVDAGRFQERSKVAGLHGLEDAPRALPRSPMPRLRWPDSTNSVSDDPGTIHYRSVKGRKKERDSTSVTKPSTKPDQAQY